MKPERAIELLNERIAEAKEVMAVSDDAPFERWRRKTWLTLQQIYGEEHYLVQQFDGLHFSLLIASSETPDSAFRRARDSGIRDAIAVLESAIFEREQLATAPVEGEDTLDPELWDHVSHLIEGEKWSQAASAAATFLEDKVREWAGLTANDYGKDLMVKVFKPQDGVFPCGNTASEEQGWQQLATGFMLAISNVDRHRIQKRHDARTYAMGVIGTASLLITQLRHQHGNRFRV